MAFLLSVGMLLPCGVMHAARRVKESCCPLVCMLLGAMCAGREPGKGILLSIGVYAATLSVMCAGREQGKQGKGILLSIGVYAARCHVCREGAG